MPLLLKSTNHKLPNNLALTITYLNHLEKHFDHHPNYRNDCFKFMEEIISRGYSEQVSESELESTNGQVS